jgi:hypothetical protein
MAVTRGLVLLLLLMLIAASDFTRAQTCGDLESFKPTFAQDVYQQTLYIAQGFQALATARITSFTVQLQNVAGSSEPSPSSSPLVSLSPLVVCSTVALNQVYVRTKNSHCHWVAPATQPTV